MKSKELKQRILEFLSKDPKKQLSHKQIIKRLGFKDKKTKYAAKSILMDLEKGGQIRHGSSRQGKTITGVVDYVNPRFAFIVSDELEEDVQVRTEHMMNALDDDVVKVAVFSRKGKRRVEGKVIEVVKRFRDEFVGRVDMSKSYAFIVPDFRKMHNDIFVQLPDLKGAKNDDKVIVKITTWPKENKNPQGVVVRLLGKSGEHEAEIHSIIAEFGLPYEFPAPVLKESKTIPDDITGEEITSRKDMRGITTFTIDPEDAKDFDDALSLRELPNGNLEVGIHIADVTHYVDRHGALEKEARKRATSVYLVDRTIPMLPERLSNALCSLRPEEDKLTFSAVFELDNHARVRNEWFGKTIIHSVRRFTYEEAQHRIENRTGDYADELEVLNKLALRLRDERFKQGAINFETVEIRVILDEEDKPIDIVPRVRKDAHKLVEEFMLLANKKVAEFVYKKVKGSKNKTFVYRVHEDPDPEKLEAFSDFAGKFGHDLNIPKSGISRALNDLIDDIEGKPEQNVLQGLAIRSMAKAVYTTREKGHFGLAFPHYTHFTSPIRRYPDMMVHRLLQHYLYDGKASDQTDYEELCRHASEMEKRASDAERASVKYKQVEFMQNLIGEELDGIVTGVTEWGIYVEMTTTYCEGMVKLADLEGDYYYLDEDNHQIIGQNTGKRIALGDAVRVLVARTDINRRIIDLDLVDVKALRS